MVNQVAQDFKHLLDNTKDLISGETYSGPLRNQVTLRYACLVASWGHDLIEDCRVSYNDIKNRLGQEAADIIYAVSNEKGKTRSERANEKYYEGIRNTNGAVFVKLCDRIANVQYSKSRMYEKENKHFIEQLGYDVNDMDILNLHPEADMFQYLINLFND
jgi:hypothetical protein